MRNNNESRKTKTTTTKKRERQEANVEKNKQSTNGTAVFVVSSLKDDSKILADGYESNKKVPRERESLSYIYRR